MPPLMPQVGNPGDPLAEVTRLLDTAKASLANRNPREALAGLHQAQTLATQNNLHREAAQLRRALSILANGGRPKLLTRPDAKLGGNEDE